MSDVIIFGGTTEGRLLAECCAKHHIQAVVCVVSDYGCQVLTKSPWLTIHRQAMTEADMISMIQNETPDMVLDATHPYAAAVTAHVVRACRETGVKYIRIARAESSEADFQKLRAAGTSETEGTLKKKSVSEASDVSGMKDVPEKAPVLEASDISGSQEVLWKETVEAAAAYLDTVEGSVFVTTGSKELEKYTCLQDYATRLYVRVLPASENLAVCERLGIRGKHLIAMQGPFTREMNTAMLRHTGARYLVTKEAGTAGGFLEKIEAAMECGVIPIVIGRPKKPEGIPLEDGIALLERNYGKQEMSDASGVTASGTISGEISVQLNLIGIGMGGSGQLTEEAAGVLAHSDAVLGAPRMLESVGAVTAGIPTEPVYLSKDVLPWLETHKEYRQVSIVYSGDTGFYSGARTLLEDLKKSESLYYVQTQVYPGISTLSYLCARLQTYWDDIYPASKHGRVQDEVELLKSHARVFLLLGGENAVTNLCRKLVEHGFSKAVVSVGERLSYPDEQIVTGTAEELQKYSFGGLAAVLIERKEETEGE